MAWFGDGVARHRRPQKGYVFVEIIQRDECAVLFSPFPHPAVTAMSPGQHLDSPFSPVHTLQVGVKADAVDEAATVARQQYRDPRIAIVVESIAQHCGLQGLIDALFATLNRAALQQNSAVLLFAKHPDVAFTNNRAERDLRMSKVKQKVSGCFRTRKYAEAYCRISSYLQSMAYQGYNPLVAIQIALAGRARLRARVVLP